LLFKFGQLAARRRRHLSVVGELAAAPPCSPQPDSSSGYAISPCRRRSRAARLSKFGEMPRLRRRQLSSFGVGGRRRRLSKFGELGREGAGPRAASLLSIGGRRRRLSKFGEQQDRCSRPSLQIWRARGCRVSAISPSLERRRAPSALQTWRARRRRPARRRNLFVSGERGGAAAAEPLSGGGFATARRQQSLAVARRAAGRGCHARRLARVGARARRPLRGERCGCRTAARLAAGLSHDLEKLFFHRRLGAPAAADCRLGPARDRNGPSGARLPRPRPGRGADFFWGVRVWKAGEPSWRRRGRNYYGVLRGRAGGQAGVAPNATHTWHHNICPRSLAANGLLARVTCNSPLPATLDPNPPPIPSCAAPFPRLYLAHAAGR
jgi:hypothetical protein